jgi:MFS transporter, BCD family, chlorophyll transporter
VVALLYVMLLVGMVVAAIAFGLLLADFSQLRLIQLIQGAAVVTLVLNFVALWKQEALDPTPHQRAGPRPALPRELPADRRQGRWTRRLVATGLGTAAFAMQDVLLEPYGGRCSASRSAPLPS